MPLSVGALCALTVPLVAVESSRALWLALSLGIAALALLGLQIVDLLPLPPDQVFLIALFLLSKDALILLLK